MKRVSLIFILLFLVCNIYCFTYSFSGWNLIDGQYVYLDSEGRKLQNSWMKSGDSTYYLDDNGFIAKNIIFEYDDHLYYLDQDGRKVSNRFVYVDNSINTPFGMKDGIYYFDENGRAVKKTNSSNFKRYIEGSYYAFDEDGVFHEGWFNKDGERVTDPESYLTEGVYYSDEKGRLLQNRWYKFSDDVGADAIQSTDDNTSGNDYNEMESLWMYFDNTCKKIYSTDAKTKTKEINGNKYAFDNNGIMVEGFTNNGSLDYTQQSNPSLTESVKLYSFNGGEAYKNQCVKVVPSKNLSTTDHYGDVPSWYYVDGSNNIVYNKLKTIDGHKYVFDGIGRMQTGFNIMDGNGFFVANYKPEDLTRDDFVYSIAEGSHLNGSEVCDLRFFELGDDNGKMLTGNMKIELADGEFEFLFKKSNGIAMGNRHELKKYSDVYYINGLKLAPLEDMKYGVVKVANDEYVVVDKNGKIKKGNRKLVKDDYDNILVILNNKLAGYIVDAHDKMKLKWVKTQVASISDLSGYYYYDGEVEVKDYVALAVAAGTTCPTPAQLKNIPAEMKLNFK